MVVLGAVFVAAIGAVGVFGPRPQVVAAEFDIEPISVAADGGEPIADSNVGPAVSANGGVVVFEASNEADRSDLHVEIRDRIADTTQAVAETPSAAPAISGDGCVVAYSVPSVAPSEGQISLVAVNRCPQEEDAEETEELVVEALIAAPLEAGVVIDTIESLGPFAAPAISEDGSTIAWSVGSEIRRYMLTNESYTLAQSFDSAIVPTAEVVTAAEVDISDDGTVIAFAAGPGLLPYTPSPANVYVWELPTEGLEIPTIELASMTAVGTDGSADSSAPALSGDGAILLFESIGQDLAATGGAETPPPFIVMLDRGNGTRVLADTARRPAISTDGHHAVYDRAGVIQMTSWVSGSPYANVTEQTITTPYVPDPEPDVVVDSDAVGESLSGPVVSQFGRWVVFDSEHGEILSDDTRFETGTHVWAADLRPADDGSLPDLTTTTTTTTTPPTSEETTTTVAGGINGPAATVPGVAVEPPIVTTLPPASTIPISTPPPPNRVFPQFPSNSRTTRTTSSGGGTTFTSPQTPPTFQPSAVEFSPTVIAAGRRTSNVSLSNTTSNSLTVREVRIEPAGDATFTVLAESCTGSPIAAGAGCSVEIQFAPTTVGAAASLLVAELADGSVVSAQVNGVGSAAPSLEVVPAVASIGQVVTVFGAGFPASATVDFSWDATPGSEQLPTDEFGTFVQVLVVLPHTPGGPIAINVAGQVDQFADVSNELLVSGGGSGSGDAALRGSVTSPYGR